MCGGAVEERGAPQAKGPPPKGKRRPKGPPPKGKRRPKGPPPQGKKRGPRAGTKRLPKRKGPPKRIPTPRGGPPVDAKATVALHMGDLFQDTGIEKTAKWTGRPEEEAKPPPISAIKAGAFDPNDVRAWLCCDPFRPVPVLTSKASINLGRKRDCDMILPHESVSKVHAVVRALGEEIVVEDRSTYGTYLNGSRVRSATVAVGDTLTIGPYQIEVRDSLERKKKKTDEDDTRPFRVVGSSAEALSGRVEKVPLTEVLQQIEFFDKSGTLKVWTESESGILVTYEGKPMYAEWDGGKVRDQEAVFTMLRLEQANFSFMSKVEAGEMTMEGTLSAILMDFSRELDEGDGAAE